MSGMAIKFTSLAQIGANQFVSANDGLYLQKAEDFGGVPRIQGCHPHVAHLLQVAADAAMASQQHPGNDRFGWHISGIRRLRQGKVGRRNWLWRLAKRRRVLTR
jgi:hypothetical protein